MNSAHGAVFSKYVSTLEGASELRYEFSKEKSSFVRRSNFFDQKKNYALGTYELTFPKEAATELSEIIAKVQAANELLKRKKLSFNDLSDKTPHAPFFFLNEFRITEGSDYYADLKRIFEKLESIEKKNFTGIRLTDDFTEVEEFKKGKLEKKRPFNFSFHCSTEQAPSVCLFKDLGILFVQK